MAQIARPVSDIAAGSWTDEGVVDNDGSLWSSLDEASSDDDSSYILDAGANSTCEVALGTLTDPNDDTNHVLHVLFRATGSGGPERLTIDLMQGAVSIEQWANQKNRSASYLDLNATMVNAVDITDYSNLRVRLTASNLGGGETMLVTQVFLSIPDAAAAEELMKAVVSGAAASSGLVSATYQLKVSPLAQAAVTGYGAALRPMTGALAGGAQVASSAGISKPMAIALSATAEVLAAAGMLKGISGSADGSGLLSGAMGALLGVSGSVTAQSILTAVAVRTAVIEAAIDASAATSANVTTGAGAVESMAVTLAAAAATQAALGRLLSIKASPAGTAAALADGSVVRSLGGLAVGSTAASVGIVADRAMAAVLAGNTDAVLTLIEMLAASGDIAGLATVAGILEGSVAARAKKSRDWEIMQDRFYRVRYYI